MLALLTVLAATGCGFRPAAPPAPPEDSCAESDGPAPGTVARAIAAVPAAAGGSWVESADGHTRDCRLYWVKLTPREATPAGPEQLLFFDRNTPLGSPTPNPRPYTTVVASGYDTVTVLYQWQIAGDPPCCPSGTGTTRYRIGSDGKLRILDPIPLN